MKRILILLAGLFLLSSSAWSAGTPKVITPNGGEKWTTGKTYVVKWNLTFIWKYRHISIRLLKNGRHVQWITKKTWNDGRFVWKIPANVSASSNYKIRIQNVGRSTKDNSDRSFSIAKAPAKPVELSKAVGLTIYEPGKTYTIGWKTSGYPKTGKVSLVLQQNRIDLSESESGLPGLFNGLFNFKLDNTGSYRWTVPSNLPDTNYTIVIWLTSWANDWVDISIGKSGAGTLPPSRYPKGNYVHLKKLNAFRLANHTVRWKSKTIYVSGANKPAWRKAINMWNPAVKFKYVKKKPAKGKGIQVFRKKLDKYTCGQAFYSYKANGQFLTCDATLQSRWSATKFEKNCGSTAGVVTHEVGHCIGLLEHSNAIDSAKGGLMDGRAGCSPRWPDCEIHPKVKNMVSLLYRLPPGTNITPKLKKSQRSIENEGNERYSADGDEIYYGSMEYLTNGQIRICSGPGVDSGTEDLRQCETRDH